MDNTSKSKSEKQYVYLLLIIVLGLYVFMRSDPLKISVEKNIYDYYSESIIKDHDLNVINQVPEIERWQITTSGNYPDRHSNGVISFWSPFFLYENLGTTEKTLSFHIHHKDLEKIEFFKKVRLDYIKRAAEEIIYDPIGIKL